VLMLSHVHLSFSSRNKMICIQSVKKHNITFQQKNMIFVFCCFCRIVVSWTIIPRLSIFHWPHKRKKHYQNIYASRFITLYFHFIGTSIARNVTIVWSCPGNMPKYYPGQRDILPDRRQDHINIIIILTVYNRTVFKNGTCCTVRLGNVSCLQKFQHLSVQ
jgi:hypothetical protein